jgi:sugar lactone lactonase YvrE
MPKTARFPGLLALFLLAARAVSAQTDTSTTIAAGTSYATEKSGVVSGVRVDVRPDGSVWFLLPALDRIAVLRGDQMTQWQIRDDTHLGANPVDFEVDGDVIWFIANGESGVDAGHSIFGRLDTATGQEREWEIPGSRPAGFYRAPDGKVWLPQTDRRLQSMDLDTLEVVDHRSGNSDGTGTQTIAYSDIILGPDGALWMTDFGNNRIVRYEPGASQETSWTLISSTTALLNPSQIEFDNQGRLWISEFTGARLERFDPASGDIATFSGFLDPIHFDLFGGRVYVTEAAGSNGQIAVLDPLLAGVGTRTIVPETLEVHPLVNARPAVVHDRTITPTTFASSPEAIAATDLPVSLGIGGILRTQIPWTNAYGIEVVGGEVWVGSSGKLARLELQTIGGPSDLVAPVATQLAGPVESEGRVDIMLYNPTDTPIAGEALYLFSPGYLAARATFNVGPGLTALLSDAFGDLGSTTIPISGPVRIRVTSGPADQLVARVRTARARADGGSFGYALPALSASQGLGSGSSRTLFTGGRDSETSVFGFYTPSGAEAVFTLVAPDGTVRGTIPLSVISNIGQEFQPAASAFGVAAEPGDVIRVEVTSGSLFPYVRISEDRTGDAAVSLPAEATSDAVFPSAGTAVGLFDTSFGSDLFLSNPDASQSAAVTVFYYPLGSRAAPASATLTLDPGVSQVIGDVLQTLFGVEPGQGTLVILSDVPVASSLRVAASKPEGDFATLALPIAPDGIVLPGASAFVIGAPQTPTRRTNLLFFNRGAAGTVTVIGYNGNNGEIGRLHINIGDHQALRVDSAMAALGADQERNGRLVVEASDGMLLYAWAAEVDGPTGDVEIIPFR